MLQKDQIINSDGLFSPRQWVVSQGSQRRTLESKAQARRTKEDTPGVSLGDNKMWSLLGLVSRLSKGFVIENHLNAGGVPMMMGFWFENVSCSL